MLEVAELGAVAWCAGRPGDGDAREPSGILLVDDQAENLLALEAILQDARPTPWCAPRLATEALSRAPPRVRRDPHRRADARIDGFETAQMIKSPSDEDIPIIFLTAIGKERQYVFKGYSVGAVDYMFKPFDRRCCGRRWRCSSSCTTSDRQSRTRAPTR